MPSTKWSKKKNKRGMKISKTGESEPRASRKKKHRNKKDEEKKNPNRIRKKTGNKSHYKTTSCPKARDGHRYPCPALAFCNGSSYGSRAAAPEGTGGDKVL